MIRMKYTLDKKVYNFVYASDDELNTKISELNEKSSDKYQIMAIYVHNPA